MRPAPFTSINGNNYYVSFLDSFSHFTWLFPMRSKLDEFIIFLHVLKLDEHPFERKIKSLQCDWGGEYRGLHIEVDYHFCVMKLLQNNFK